MTRRLIFVLVSARMSWLTIWTVVTGTTIILYLLPNAGLPRTFNIDKIVHFIAFGTIGLPAWPGTRHQRPFRLFVVAGLCLAIGLE